MERKDSIITHSTRWDMCFNKQMAHVGLSYPTDNTAVIICQNIYLESLKNVAMLIEQERFCEYCEYEKELIRMISPDFEILAITDIADFLTKSFEQEGYEIEIHNI